MNVRNKSVLFCWELGGGMGHVAKAVLLAEALLDEGCEVTFAFRDLADVHALLPMEDYRLVQSPVWSRLATGMPEPASYPELLLHFGFGSPVGMMGLCRAWRSLLTAFSVDLVIADHAPNAIVAARTMQIPVATFGNGFFVPPLTDPMPPFRPAAGHDSLSAERLALRSVNACLATFGQQPLPHLSDLFDVQRNLLCTVPELDHYLTRPAGKMGTIEHVGPVYVDQAGEAFVWPARPTPDSKRIFAYLYAHMQGLDAILDALAGSGADVVVFCSGLPDKVLKAYAGTKLQFLKGLVNLKAMVESVNLFVCGGTDTAYCAVFNGVPLLGVPVTMEQQLSCERIAAVGAGRWSAPGSSREHWSQELALVLSDGQYREAAQGFAGRHAEMSPAKTIEAIAHACLELMGAEECSG